MFRYGSKAVASRITACFIVLALLAGLTLSAQAQNGRMRVVLRNDSSYTIYQIHMSRTNDDNWRRDLLGFDVLSPGESITITASPGMYDLKLVDEDGDTCTVLRLSIHDNKDWTITNSWLLGCEFH
jgi:hypothetical protein